MTTQDYATRISQLIQDHEAEIGGEWVEQLNALTLRSNVVSKDQLRKHCQQFLAAFAQAARGGELQNIDHRSWDEVRDLLSEISSSRAKNGSTPSEANVARSGGGSSAEVEATGNCESSSAILLTPRRVQECGRERRELTLKHLEWPRADRRAQASTITRYTLDCSAG